MELKPYRQKDGALLAIGSLCDRLKQTEPYKSELEHMLVQHVFPEFDSHVGHLRAKVHFAFCSFYNCFLTTNPHPRPPHHQHHSNVFPIFWVSMSIFILFVWICCQSIM